ncbi:glycosyltransferase family 2 protein [Burkholderia sp. BCC1644]|uniref:glycosyltransferase family 2 protein n=1 Tax=Burkholderia sp. BCC1644 TaxID=2676293 RepID=UPI001ABB5CA0|nr:glycosyltransferase family 2 protein [Burkholderia sp. BCC1644]
MMTAISTHGTAFADAPSRFMCSPSRRALSILIVTYNSAGEIGTQLDALRADAERDNWQVIVLDNASADGTADLVERRHPWVTLVRCPRNLGFAAGNNLAARHADGSLLLLLNPDAEPAPGAIRAGVARMRARPEVGVAGARLTGGDGSDQPSARMFPSILNDVLAISGLSARYPRSRLFGRADRTWCDPAAPARVDWVPGAFALVRRDLFCHLGGFDERFFLYYEEVDLCRRVKQRGFDVCYWPDLVVRHVGGVSARSVSQSTGEAFSGAGAQLTLWRMRSAMLYYRKHHGLPAAWLASRAELGWHALRMVRNARAGAAPRQDKVADSKRQAAMLKRAWRETMGGRVSPPTPW